MITHFVREISTSPDGAFTAGLPCVHRQGFETLQHASRVIGDWIGFYNQRRPHQALKRQTPNQAFENFELAACPVQKPLGHYTDI